MKENNCNHEIKIELNNNILISYCTKCGKILDQQTVNLDISCDENLTNNWNVNKNPIIFE